MNGQETLAYARSRHATSDFDRSARQQRVITSVREQTDINDLLRPGVINDLIKLVRKDVKTNIPTQLVPKMLSLAQDIDFDRRENLVLGSSRYVTTCYPCGSSGLWMLKTNPSAIKNAVRNVFSTSKAAAKSINTVAGEEAVVHVLNGAGGPNTKSLKIASGLANKGMNAIVPPVNGGKADNSDYRNAVITFYNGAEERMPETAKRLKRAIKDKQREIVSVEDPEAEADIVITVGSSTKT
jgi:hypothetical protein